MAWNTDLRKVTMSASRKLRLPVLLLLLVSLVLASAMTSRADELWTENYYRALDTTEQLSEAERDSIDRECIDLMKNYGVDFACLSLAPEHHDETSFRELAEEYYTEWEFGYGESKDGFFFLFDAASGEGEIIPFGNAGEKIPESYLQTIVQNSLKFYDTYGIHGVMYGGVRYTALYLQDHAGDKASGTVGTEAAVTETAGTEAAVTETSGTETAGTQTAVTETAGTETAGTRPDKSDPAVALASGDTNRRVGEGSDLPAWYLADPALFVPFHDETASRVVDDADIFTDEEEARMEARVGEIRKELDRDIVVYTNKSACGMDHSIMAADFYDFNGYGCGDDFEGVCLYVCMDPEDRGWWVACTGPDTKGLYTEDIANDIDDALFEFMVDGEYGAGVLDWIENFRMLYVKGDPFAPDWYPERGAKAPERFHDSSAPRVVDDSGILTEEQLQDLRDYAKKISDKYGLDVVVNIAPRSGNLTREEYAKLFYEYNGYGLGDDYDGILLTVFKRQGYQSDNCLYASGKGLEKLTEVNRERLRGFVQDGMDGGNYHFTLKRFLQQTDHMERTGRVPRSLIYWIFMTVLSAVSGVIVGGISLFKASLRMAVPKMQENADAYLVPGSLIVKNLGEVFLGSSTTSKYIPPVSRSSGGGSSSSSGRSSYRSSYSGSSGRSHSGSGRRF